MVFLTMSFPATVLDLVVAGGNWQELRVYMDATLRV